MRELLASFNVLSQYSKPTQDVRSRNETTCYPSAQFFVIHMVHAMACGSTLSSLFLMGGPGKGMLD